MVLKRSKSLEFALVKHAETLLWLTIICFSSITNNCYIIRIHYLKFYIFISNDLWTTSAFNALSPHQRHRHNPWPKGSFLKHFEFRHTSLFMKQLIIFCGHLFKSGFFYFYLYFYFIFAPTSRMPDASWWYLSSFKPPTGYLNFLNTVTLESM